MYIAVFLEARFRNAALEIDHHIPLEVGGADVKANLWPQSYDTAPWNAAVKDRIENYIREQVCTAHTITLEQGQKLFKGDWITGLQKISRTTAMTRLSIGRCDRRHLPKRGVQRTLRIPSQRHHNICMDELIEPLRSHSELRGAVILAGKRIRKLNFGRSNDPSLNVLRCVLRREPVGRAALTA